MIDKIAKPASKIAKNTSEIISKLGFKNDEIIFISDEKIFENCAKFFDKNFLNSVEKLILKNPKADEKTAEKIKKSARNFKCVIGLGSGTINDLCKYTSAQLNIFYVIFPSAPSMNGYLSQNASIKIHDHKKTILAKVPDAIFCDLEILKSAPQNLIKAGIGDAMCFYGCWFDWYLSHLILGTKFDKKPFEILEKKMEFFVKNFSKFSLKDEKFLEILIEILLLSGQGMTIAGGSYPASQSEHLIAHCIDMKYKKNLENILHGSQIAVTTLTASKLQKTLLGRDSLQLKETEFPTEKLQKFFGKKIAKECEKEFLQKKLTVEEINKINASLNKNWKKYREELSKIYFDEKDLKKIFSHFKIKTSEKIFHLSSQQYQECASNARFIRNRFTCLEFLFI